MRKMSTLFVKDPNDLGRVIDQINPENQWVFDDKGVTATRKFDGTSCAIIDGKLYKRYDAKLVRLALSETQVSVGDLIRKKSNKPFKNGEKTEVVQAINVQNPNDPKRRVSVKVSTGGIIGEYQCCYEEFSHETKKPIPDNAIPYCDPDPKSGHWPHWVPCDRLISADKYHFEGYDTYLEGVKCDFEGTLDGVNFDGTFELCGPKVQGNPEGFDTHLLVRHGSETMLGCTENLKNGIIQEFKYFNLYLSEVDIEGIVFYHPDGRMCKLRKSDFGIKR